MSFLDKFKATATKVGTQATAFGHTVAREAQTGSQKALTNFKLENEVRSVVGGSAREKMVLMDFVPAAPHGFAFDNLRAPPAQCEKSAKILASFLADPQHPESALNAIPKEVLRRAKGSVTPSSLSLFPSTSPPFPPFLFALLEPSGSR